jgi:uncharacterized protein (DUF1330 family)
MSAYFFVNVLEVLDPDKMEAYRSRVFDVVARHGGRYRGNAVFFEPYRPSGDAAQALPADA